MFTNISDSISQAAHFLKLGQAVAIPTETVYGLAANIYNESAIRSIFELKQRPLNNPLIVHIHSFDQLNDIAVNIPEVAYQLARKFWPGPLTLVLEKQEDIPDLITANKPTVGIRMPNHPVTLELLKSLDFPLAAPSANPFKRISPTNPERVFEYFENKLSFILDGGECQSGIESTIVGFREGNPVIYRLGALAQEKIEEITGTIEVTNTDNKAPVAPGMLDKHYSPCTELIVTESIEQEVQKNRGRKIGLLSFRPLPSVENVVLQKSLTENSDLEEAAHNLYEYLQELDESNLDIIIAEFIQEKGLGDSINDRLKRASHK